MVENESPQYPMNYEATELQPNDALDFHKGGKDQLALDEARNLAAAANAKIEAAQQQHETESIESALLRIGENIEQLRRLAIAETSPAEYAKAA